MQLICQPSFGSFWYERKQKKGVLQQVPGKIQQVICTGTICDRQTYEYLRSLASEVHMVKGDFDEVCSAHN